VKGREEDRAEREKTEGVDKSIV